MKRVLFVFITVAFYCSSGFSQSVPGYLGKRWGVYYEASLSPSLLNPVSSDLNTVDRNAYGFSGIRFNINWQHHLVNEYVLSKKYSLKGDLHYLKTYFDPFAGNSSFIIEQFPGISAMGLDLGLKRYRKHFAPVGYFSEFRLGYTNMQVGDMDYVYNNNADSTLSISGGSKGLVSVALAWGVNRVVRDQFLITFGLELSYVVGSIRYSNKLLGTPEVTLNPDWQGPVEIQENYMNLAGGRVGIQRLINFRLGVGILP